MNTYTFDQRKIEGDEGENQFLKDFSNLNPKRFEGKNAFDFLVMDDRKVELKTDTYDMRKTLNFFMETLTKLNNGEDRMGGPWRAMRDKVYYFVYYFKQNRTYFWFKPEPLCNLLSTIIVEDKLDTISVKNTDCGVDYALGYKIPRDKVSSVVIAEFNFGNV